MSHSEQDAEAALDIVKQTGEKLAEPRSRVIVSGWFWLTLMALVAVALFLSAAVALLARNQDTARLASKHQIEVNDCRNAFTSNISETSAETRRATAEVLIQFSQAVLGIKTGFDPAPLQAAIAATQAATAADSKSVLDRNAWVNAGSPLPCPLKPDGTPVG